jgi:tetratricopeptide (TPR) repeat protein
MPNGPIQVQSQAGSSRLLRRALRAHESGELAKAERLYNALLQHHPDNFDALHGLGQLHCQRGRYDTALVMLQAALRSDGGRAEGFASLGLVFYYLRRHKEALVSYDAGLSRDPGNAELLNRRGVALLELNRPREALNDFERVLAGEPQHFEALGNCGNALIKLNRPQEAVAAYDRALARAPTNAQLLTNRAVALRRLDRPQEALMSASRALVGNPGFAQARFVESVARLTLGDFAAGWRGYESRWSVGLLASQRRNFTVPLWLGKETPQLSLDGKTILLHAEQGFGDTIQFVRYASLLARCGAASVVLEVQRELKPLLLGIAGAATVIARGDPLPAFDLHCPLLSLPLAFATDLTGVPADVPYIGPSEEKVALWRARLPRQRPLVGVAWSGDRGHDNDLNRSIALAMLAPLFGGAEVAFVSLQHDVRDSDEPALRSLPNLFRLETKFSDFADTAAAVSLMDAVIAVDTAVAHLAGAMGKALLLLLPFAADFRWLRERTDSPWYPTARLYRQPEFGDWQSVVASLRHDLARADWAPPRRKMSA